VVFADELLADPVDDSVSVDVLSCVLSVADWRQPATPITDKESSRRRSRGREFPSSGSEEVDFVTLL
jgi:hypothetical protein